MSQTTSTTRAPIARRPSMARRVSRTMTVTASIESSAVLMNVPVGTSRRQRFGSGWLRRLSRVFYRRQGGCARVAARTSMTQTVRDAGRMVEPGSAMRRDTSTGQSIPCPHLSASAPSLDDSGCQKLAPCANAGNCRLARARRRTLLPLSARSCVRALTQLLGAPCGAAWQRSFAMLRVADC